MTPIPQDVMAALSADAGARDDVRTIEALVPLWLSDNREEREGEDFPWSTLCVFELRHHPEEAWIFVRQALSAAETVWQVIMLAAGPLEDLITEHGALIIDRIEREARHSSRFRFALTGVWPQGMEDTPTWARVEAARASSMPTGIDAGAPLPPR